MKLTQTQQALLAEITRDSNNGKPTMLGTLHECEYKSGNVRFFNGFNQVGVLIETGVVEYLHGMHDLVQLVK